MHYIFTSDPDIMFGAATYMYLHGGGLDLVDPDVALSQLVVAAAAVGDDLDTVQRQLNVPADKNRHKQWTNANIVQRQLNVPADKNTHT